jgi:hypothetical protein
MGIKRQERIKQEIAKFLKKNKVDDKEKKEEGFVVIAEGGVLPKISSLETFLFPQSLQEFVDRIFRKRPFANLNGSRDRVRGLVKKYLFELDLELMLMNSASVDLDNGGNERGIHVWTRKVDSGKIQSVSVDWKSALCLFEAASSNLALYFRSPQNMADEIAAEFAQDLGLDFGSRFMNGDVKPEIEVFVSHKGHCTEWHTDFQENFTFQLKGSKKWFLAKGSYCPLRACTPHYHANEGVEEMQAKAHLIGENADLMKIPTEWEEIILNEGDVLYHPAGVWHKVETLTESVSINISLVGLSWAELMSEAVFHLLARKSEMRRMMSILSTNHANEQANDALNYLKESLENLNANG